MVSKTTVIKNPSGLHLQPTGILCKEALRYKLKISFKMRIITANAKSVSSILRVCMKSGDKIEFVCEGSDEKEALEAMVGIMETGLGE